MKEENFFYQKIIIHHDLGSIENFLSISEIHSFLRFSFCVSSIFCFLSLKHTLMRIYEISQGAGDCSSDSCNWWIKDLTSHSQHDNKGKLYHVERKIIEDLEKVTIYCDFSTVKSTNQLSPHDWKLVTFLIILYWVLHFVISERIPIICYYALYGNWWSCWWYSSLWAPIWFIRNYFNEDVVGRLAPSNIQPRNTFLRPKELRNSNLKIHMESLWFCDQMTSLSWTPLYWNLLFLDFFYKNNVKLLKPTQRSVW
jgi:hypothetical protein